MVVRVPETHEVKDQALRDIGYGGELEESRVVALDFRETSPSNCEKDTYGTHKAGRMAAQVGGLAIGVPGELRGLEAGMCNIIFKPYFMLFFSFPLIVYRTLSAHKLYGTLPWKDVVMPVAELAKGWRVSRELARRLRVGDILLLLC